jgi:hypothetical protein
MGPFVDHTGLLIYPDTADISNIVQVPVPPCRAESVMVGNQNDMFLDPETIFYLFGFRIKITLT